METTTPRVSADIKGEGFAAGVRAAFRSLYEAIQILQNGKIIVPLLVYFAIKILLIISFIESGTGGLHAFWSFLLPGGHADGLKHYPHHVMLLPLAIQRLDIALDIFIHIIAQGMTVLLVAAAYRGESISVISSFHGTMRRYGHLVIVMIVAIAAIFIVANIPYLIPISPGSLPHRHIPTAAGIVLGLITQAFFIYAVPIVLLSVLPAFGALRDNIRFAFRNYTASITLALVTFIVSLPTFLLGFKSQLIALRLFPELLIYIQMTAELLQFVSTYLLVGGVTVLFLKKTGQPGADS